MTQLSVAHRLQQALAVGVRAGKLVTVQFRQEPNIADAMSMSL